MFVVVVGATGKVGRASIRELLARGQPVRAVLRDPSKAADLIHAGCEIAVADVRDASALEAAFTGARAVQIICPMSLRAIDALSEMRVIVEALGAALEAARSPAVVAISDYGAEVEADTGITLLFHHFEARLSRIDAGLTFVRSAEQMQNWSRYLRFAADTGILPSMHHPLTKAFPTVAAEDVGVVSADLLLTANGSASPRIVHVEGPRRYTPVGVAAILRDVLGREVRARELPRADWLTALTRAGVGESYAKLVVGLFDAHNAGRIDVEPGVGEVRLGKTELVQVVESIHLQSQKTRQV